MQQPPHPTEPGPPRALQRLREGAGTAPSTHSGAGQAGRAAGRRWGRRGVLLALEINPALTLLLYWHRFGPAGADSERDFPGAVFQAGRMLDRGLLQDELGAPARAAAPGMGFSSQGPAWVFLTSTLIPLEFILSFCDFMTWLAG